MLESTTLLQARLSPACAKLQHLYPLLAMSPTLSKAAKRASSGGSSSDTATSGSAASRGSVAVAAEGSGSASSGVETPMEQHPLTVPPPTYGFGLETTLAQRVVPGLRKRAQLEVECVGLAYQAYCVQKEMERAEKTALDALRAQYREATAALVAHRHADIAAAFAVAEGEHRHAIVQAYIKFVSWVNDSTIGWLADARAREQQRLVREKMAFEHAEAERQALARAELMRMAAVEQLNEQRAREAFERDRMLAETREQERQLRLQVEERQQAEEARRVEDERRREFERQAQIERLAAEQQLVEQRLQRERDEKYAALLQQEEEVTARLHEKERQRRQLQEHLQVEEQLLRDKMQRETERRERDAEQLRQQALAKLQHEERALQQRIERRESEQQRREEEEAALARVRRERELERLREEELRAADTLEARERARQIQRDSWLAAQAEMLRAEQEALESRIARDSAIQAQRQFYTQHRAQQQQPQQQLSAPFYTASQQTMQLPQSLPSQFQQQFPQPYPASQFAPRT